jgi:hypothetical protein
MRLWPVFVVPRHFAILTTRPFSFPPQKVISFFVSAVGSYLFVLLYVKTLVVFFQKKEGCSLSLIL